MNLWKVPVLPKPADAVIFLRGFIEGQGSTELWEGPGIER